jgi:hypothetical protein
MEQLDRLDQPRWNPVSKRVSSRIAAPPLREPALHALVRDDRVEKAHHDLNHPLGSLARTLEPICSSVRAPSDQITSTSSCSREPTQR